MTYYLTVDVGSFKHHVFAFEDKMRAQSAYVTLNTRVTHLSSPTLERVTVHLDSDDEAATFRVTDLRAVSLVQGRP